jgi:hypothetical protein
MTGYYYCSEMVVTSVVVQRVVALKNQDARWDREKA